jgi:hypothetical protein
MTRPRKEKFELSPLGKWVERMKTRVWRQEWRAKLAEAKARTRKAREEKPKREGRSAPRSGVRQRRGQEARG